MDLTDLIDLEAQLAQDREVDAARLADRDAALARRLGPADRAEPRRAVAAWLYALRESEPKRAFPGRAVARALRLLGAVAVLVGLGLGWGVASALLAYDGSRPVNVMDFLWAIVGVQLVLLVLLVAALLAPRATGRIPILGDLRSLAAWLYPRLARRLSGGGAESWAAILHRLRSRRSLYAQLEPWLLLGLTQAFGIAFNLGVLLALLRLVVLTDLAFAWSTTLQVEATDLHAVVRALAAPWAWAFPDAAPSLELVEATRYSRLTGAYVNGAGPLAAGGWWPFLVAATVTYGLLPRTLAWAVARVQRARLLSRVRLDDVESRRLLARLTGPAVETRGVGPEDAAAEAPAPPPPSLAFEGGPCAAVLWRDVPAARDRLSAAVRARFGCEVNAVVTAGGADFEADRAAARALGSEQAAGAPVLVVAEAWEAPDKALLGFLREVRASVPPRRPIVVGLVGAAEGEGWSAPGEDEARTWRERIASLEDPFLGLEILEVAP